MTTESPKKQKMPHDVRAIWEFYRVMSAEPYHVQRAAINWLSARLDADKMEHDAADMLKAKEVPSDR